MEGKIITESVEVCPHCGHENVYPNYDVEGNAYKAICDNCKQEIMLCDECLHSDDNENQICDWSEKNGCFREKSDSYYIDIINKQNDAIKRLNDSIISIDGSKRKNEFDFMLDMIESRDDLDEVLVMQQIRCLWTALCLRYDMIVDTYAYDRMMEDLWLAMENSINSPYSSDEYERFYNAMSKYLV